MCIIKAQKLILTLLVLKYQPFYIHADVLAVIPDKKNTVDLWGLGVLSTEQ